jgi:hypothetical protein
MVAIPYEKVTDRESDYIIIGSSNTISSNICCCQFNKNMGWFCYLVGVVCKP